MITRNISYIIGVLAVVVALVSSTLYVVSETEQVVITAFGEPKGKPIVNAGLQFKWPWQKANFFEKRIMKWDGSPNQIPTKDKKYIWVDTTARWRIKDPLLFLQRLIKVETAMSRLDGIIDSVVRDHVSNNYLVDLVRSEGWEDQKEDALSEEGYQEQRLPPSGRADAAKEEDLRVLTKGREQITRDMLADAAALVPEFGIELLDIRIKRINYVDSVQRKVFDRMISERKRIAAQYRSEGEGERAAILGQMERELARISSDAYRQAQEIRGKADAEATRIYAEAFGKNVDFYEFFRTMQLYQEFDSPRSVFVLTTEADLFKYLKGSGSRAEK